MNWQEWGWVTSQHGFQYSQAAILDLGDLWMNYCYYLPTLAGMQYILSILLNN